MIRPLPAHLTGYNKYTVYLKYHSNLETWGTGLCFDLLAHTRSRDGQPVDTFPGVVLSSSSLYSYPSGMYRDNIRVDFRDPNTASMINEPTALKVLRNLNLPADSKVENETLFLFLLAHFGRDKKSWLKTASVADILAAETAKPLTPIRALEQAIYEYHHGSNALHNFTPGNLLDRERPAEEIEAEQRFCLEYAEGKHSWKRISNWHINQLAKAS